MNDQRIPKRKTALEFAYKVENSSGELHHRKQPQKKDPDEITRIFMRLNDMNFDHATRILK